MHVISALVAGIRGAENGSVRIYARGTATRATLYESFEGEGADSSGADVPLDENGGLEVYVNELVDVVVLDSDGVELRRFTDGYSASSIEVRSQSFTGTNYDDASSGAGSNYPLTLAQVLDRWKDKTGAIDWDVLLGSSTETLLGALGVVAGPLVYNVKSDEYGALGDGVTDDAVAISAAVSAATAAGGIVFFPPGTYHVATSISVPARVSLLGCGSSASILSRAAVAGEAIIFTGSGSYAKQWMVGLRVQVETGSDDASVLVASAARVAISHCYLGGSNDTGPAISLVSTSTTEMTVTDCTLVTAGTALPAVLHADGAKSFLLHNCKLIASNAAFASATGLVSAKTIKCVDCVFDGSAVSAGAFSYFVSNSTTLNASFRGCKFLNGTGATVTALELGSYAAASVFEESESVFGSTVVAYSYTVAAASLGAEVYLRSRDRRVLRVATNAAGYTPPIDQYGTVIITRSNATAQTLSAAYPPDGARGAIVVFNDNVSPDPAVPTASAFTDGFYHTFTTPIVMGVDNIAVINYQMLIAEDTLRVILQDPTNFFGTR